MKNFYEFDYETSIMSTDGNSFELVVKAIDSEDFAVFSKSGVLLNFEALPKKDQISIKDRLESHYCTGAYKAVMEEACEYWDDLNSEYYFGLVQDLNRSRDVS